MGELHVAHMKKIVRIYEGVSSTLLSQGLLGSWPDFSHIKYLNNLSPNISASREASANPVRKTVLTTM